MKVSLIKQFTGSIKESFEAGKQGHMVAVNFELQTSKPVTVFDNIPVLVNNKALVLMASVPSFIAGALMGYGSNGKFLIIVNEEFTKLPKYVQEAFYCHELGHIVNKHTSNKLDLIKEKFRI